MTPNEECRVGFDVVAGRRLTELERGSKPVAREPLSPACRRQVQNGICVRITRDLDDGR
jgi:hypothetical protein